MNKDSFEKQSEQDQRCIIILSVINYVPVFIRVCNLPTYLQLINLLIASTASLVIH